jgi:hypothetical protein
MTLIEMQKDKMKLRMEAYNKEVRGRLRDEGSHCRHEYENAFFIEDEEDDEVVDPEEPTDVNEADEFMPEGYDE